MLITITNEQKVEVTLAPVTEAGNAATVDGCGACRYTNCASVVIGIGGDSRPVRAERG